MCVSACKIKKCEILYFTLQNCAPAKISRYTVYNAVSSVYALILSHSSDPTLHLFPATHLSYIQCILDDLMQASWTRMYVHYTLAIEMTTYAGLAKAHPNYQLLALVGNMV